MDDLLRKKSALKLKIVARQTHWRTLKNSSSFTICLPFFASDTTEKHWTKGKRSFKRRKKQPDRVRGTETTEKHQPKGKQTLREGRSSLTESEGLSASRSEYKLSACCHAPLASHHIPSNRAAHVVKDHHVIVDTMFDSGEQKMHWTCHSKTLQHPILRTIKTPQPVSF